MSVEEKVINKYLIMVSNPHVLELKVKNLNFLFPIKDLCVGVNKTYTITEIKNRDAYLLINRILDRQALKILEELLNSDLSLIKGICFTDLGVINLVKKHKPHLELIYFGSHNTTNYQTINYYLEYCDSLLISTDITLPEINLILDKAIKPLVLPYFILPEVMYSRRYLLTNYQTYYNLPIKKEIELLEPISKEKFLVFENEYGSVFYNHNFLDYRKYKFHNILYYYINPYNLDNNTILDIIKGKEVSLITSEGFLNKETIYKLKGE